MKMILRHFVKRDMKLYVKDGTKATTRCGFNEEPLSLQLQADSLFPHVPKKHKTLLPQSF